MSTKERILDAARALFNAQNTQAATTNHIAAACHMSPGNLNYHYKNREAIVFALYEQMLSKTVLDEEDLPATMTSVHEHEQYLVGIYFEYRFFHRELLFLLSRDEMLKTRYIADNIAHRKRIAKVIEQLEENGYLKLPDASVGEYLCDTILLNTQFWESYLETLDRPVNESGIRSGFGHIQQAMRPYMTPKALQELETEAF